MLCTPRQRPTHQGCHGMRRAAPGRLPATSSVFKVFQRKLFPEEVTKRKQTESIWILQPLLTSPPESFCAVLVINRSSSPDSTAAEKCSRIRALANRTMPASTCHLYLFPLPGMFCAAKAASAEQTATHPRKRSSRPHRLHQAQLISGHCASA